jgi:hypothetical protein
MSNERKQHTPEEKVTILRRHLVDRVPVSTLCDEQDHEARLAKKFQTHNASTQHLLTRSLFKDLRRLLSDRNKRGPQCRAGKKRPKLR